MISHKSINIKKKIVLGLLCAKAILFKQRKPFFISWAITERCNLRCRYCNAWKSQSLELQTYQIIEIIKSLSKMGMKMIRFTGGEPLLREDIGTIINFCQTTGILTYLSTNGILLPKRIEEIRNIDSINLSLDGPEDIHDYIRGQGAHKKVIDAIELAKNNNVAISLSTTLSSANLSCIEYLLGIAKKYKIKIFFQPSSKIVLYGKEPNPVAPEANQYRQAISQLMRFKLRNKSIGNSMAGLKHLYNWPNKTYINCVAGKFICKLDSKGNVKPCSRFILKNNNLNITENSIKHCFNQLYSPYCGECWCSSFVELNLVLGFNMSALMNSLKI